MKNLLLISSVIFILCVSVILAEPSNKNGEAAGTTALTYESTRYIDANNILMLVSNFGTFGRDPQGVFGYYYGTFYPYAGDPQLIYDGVTSAIRSPLYAAGLWMGGVDSATGEVRVAVAEYSTEYTTGPMSGGTYQTDDPTFRVYRLNADSLALNPNPDYTAYLQYAVAQGAPVIAGDVDTVPAMVGDQMLWSVYNDANVAKHTNSSGDTNPLGVEVRQTIFSYDEPNLNNVIFLRYRIYNKGDRTLFNFYPCIWSDPDLGGSGDDKVGVDTISQVGYCYNANNADAAYGSAPPCMGICLLQGPAYYTGNSSDTAFSFGKKIAGFRNGKIAAFANFINGTDPDNAQQTYNYMRGLQADGNPYQYNFTPVTFFCSGDPVIGTGDLDTAIDDKRMIVSTGPLTLRPRDSTEIIAALIIGQGGDRLSSISVMRMLTSIAYNKYASLIETPLAADDEEPALPALMSLRQNYPNPFNPNTTIEYYLQKNTHATLTIYNILGEEIARPLDKFMTAGEHTCTWDGRDKTGQLVSSGIYLYKLTAENSTLTKRMVLLK